MLPNIREDWIARACELKENVMRQILEENDVDMEDFQAQINFIREKQIHLRCHHEIEELWMLGKRIGYFRHTFDSNALWLTYEFISEGHRQPEEEK
jgi:hypothetical protein